MGKAKFRGQGTLGKITERRVIELKESKMLKKKLKKTGENTD